MGWFENAVNVAAPGLMQQANAVRSNPEAVMNSNPYIAQANLVKENPRALAYTHPYTAQMDAMGMFGGKDQQGSGIPMYGANAAARNADINAGYAKGKEIFYDDPDMQSLRDKRMDLAKGYNGQTLGAMQGQANSELQGQRSNYLNSLAGRAAKSGMGGARAAAMQANADVGLQGNQAEMQRKMVLDQANQVNKGTDNLQDFLMRQKYGMLGTGTAYGQLGVADRSADAQAAIAGKEQDRGILGNFLKPLIG